MDFSQGPVQGSQQPASRRRALARLADRGSKIAGDFELNAPTASTAIAEIARVSAGECFPAIMSDLESRLAQTALEIASAFAIAAAHAYDAVGTTAAVQRQDPKRRMRHSSGRRLVEAVAGYVQ